MLFDVEQELHALFETIVSPRPQQDKWEAEEMKRGLKTLTDDENEKTGKPEHHALASSPDSAVHPDTLKQFDGQANGECFPHQLG